MSQDGRNEQSRNPRGSKQNARSFYIDSFLAKKERFNKEMGLAIELNKRFMGTGVKLWVSRLLRKSMLPSPVSSKKMMSSFENTALTIGKSVGRWGMGGAGGRQSKMPDDSKS